MAASTLEACSSSTASVDGTSAETPAFMGREQSSGWVAACYFRALNEPAKKTSGSLIGGTCRASTRLDEDGSRRRTGPAVGPLRLKGA